MSSVALGWTAAAVCCYLIPTLWWWRRGTVGSYVWPSTAATLMMVLTGNAALMLIGGAAAIIVCAITRPPQTRKPRWFARAPGWAVLSLVVAAAAGVPAAIHDNPIPALLGTGYGWEVLLYGWWAGALVVGVAVYQFHHDKQQWRARVADQRRTALYAAAAARLDRHTSARKRKARK